MMNWKVIAKIKPSKYEPEYEREVAQFESYVNAEDFINLVMPVESKDRFKIEHV